MKLVTWILLVFVMVVLSFVLSFIAAVNVGTWAMLLSWSLGFIIAFFA